MKGHANTRVMITGLLLCTSAIAGDTVVEAPDFTIEVVLTERARAYLIAHSENVRINISFADVIGPGWHYLGGMNREIAPAISTSLQVRNIAFDPKETAALKSPNYEVLVNVTSAFRSFDKGILNCDLLQDYINKLQRKTHTLRCELGKSAPK
jgi:hypothetical protein